MKKKYHGWIYRQKENGKNDCFHIQFNAASGGSVNHFMGYAAGGAADSVAFFETEKVGNLKGLNLGPVKLEETPLGLRVFTEEPEAK